MLLVFGCGEIPAQYTGPDDSRFVLLPIPYDGTSTWMKGADKGPEEIIRTSENLEFYDIETDTEAFRRGIFTAEPITEASSPEAMIEAAQTEAKKYLDKDKFLIVIGGEHSVSIPPIYAHCEKYDNLSVLQLDAHADLRPDYQGSPYNHACVMARVREKVPAVQVGIRSMDAAEKQFIEPDRTFFAHNIRRSTAWHDKAIEQLTQNVYITIDLDVFDPSLLPATGTPEPGGLLWYDVLEFLKKVFARRNVAGFDVVELCPNPNHPASAFIAARLIYKLISYKNVS